MSPQVSVRHLRVWFTVTLITALVAWNLGGCRSPSEGAPSAAQRSAIEKPWTKEAIESHEYLWLEFSTGKRGVMTGPVLASDEKGDFLTTKADPSVHLPLADVLVMDGVDLSKPADEASFTAVLAGSFLALWGAVFYFLPAIAVYLILA